MSDRAAPARAVILTGPTGVGKTAVSLALARRLPLRVISADSMQVYRRMDIGTAKPGLQERSAAPHYCLDLVDPDHPFTVAEYLAAALPAIAGTLADGELPLIVGGTRLYLYALTGGFDQGPPPNPDIRSRLDAEATERGLAALHARLLQIDPASAASVHPNDRKRIIRAIEVFESTGKQLSSIQLTAQQTAPAIEAAWIALVGERAELYRAAEARTSVMIRAGWLDEVAGLVSDGYGPYLELIKAHGYREMARVVQGSQTLEDAIVRNNQNVRNYIRYQLGWIRNRPDVHTVAIRGSAEEIAEQILPIVGQMS